MFMVNTTNKFVVVKDYWIDDGNLLKDIGNANAVPPEACTTVGNY